MHPRRPFVPVPTELALTVSPGAARVWLVLDDLARTDPIVRVSRDQLATVADISVRTLTRLLNELCEAGYLRKHRTGRATVYEPLGRARLGPQLVDNVGDNPAESVDNVGDNGVDNYAISVDSTTPDGPNVSHQIGQIWPISTMPIPPIRARVKKGPDTPSWPAWCGNCDELTRQRERADGRLFRCPSCHPQAYTPPLF